MDLFNNLSGLDDELLLLVLAATAHAAGRPRLLAPASAVAASPGWDQTERAQSFPGRHTGPRHTSSRDRYLDQTTSDGQTEIHSNGATVPDPEIGSAYRARA